MSADDARFDQALLDRHRPQLRFDPQYDYRVLAASSAVDNPGNLLRRGDGEVIARAGSEPPLSLETLTRYPGELEPDRGDCLSMTPDYPGDSRRMEWEEEHRGRIYGRVVEDGGRTWLQYWYWLYYNPKNLFGFGKHEGDWEMIQLGLGPGGDPEVATYAQHDTGEARRFRAGEMELVEGDPPRPVVYVAPLSHASYFEPDTHPYLLGIDHPFRGGPAAELPVVRFGGWRGWPGKWGNTERTIGGRIGNGPGSPARQGRKWTAPAAWHAKMRHRRARVLLGRAMHALGALTAPPKPRLTASRVAGGRAVVDWELAGRGRHLYVTVHERHFVLASRVVRGAAATGRTEILLPPGRAPDSVMASVYNGLRQRSDIAAVPLSG